MPFAFEEGAPFPMFEFACVALENGEPRASTISNQTLRGRAFVLWVYPKDQTSGCTLEAREFALLHDELQNADAEVVGLSRDSIRSHQNFIKKSELPYRLIADERRELIGG